MGGFAQTRLVTSLLDGPSDDRHRHLLDPRGAERPSRLVAGRAGSQNIIHQEHPSGL